MTRVKVAAGVDEPVTAPVLAQAIKRGRQRRAHQPALEATSLRYVPAQQALHVAFADGSALVLPTKNYAELDALSAADLARLELCFAGTALCLEESDLHVSIEGLVAGSLPLMAMMTRVVATQNGLRRSAAKVSAARANGAKGGRPRRVVAAG